MATKEETSSLPALPHLDLESPRWDQSTFVGRFKHFLNITDARLSLCTDKQLEDAKELVMQYK